jgi:hypothetical protein
LLAFLAAGILYSLLLPSALRYPDESEYLALSANIVHGHGHSLDGIHPSALRPPGYSYFLAAVTAFGGGVAWIRIVQFFLIAGTILLVTRLVDETARPPRLLIVTLLTLAYPISFYMAGTLYPQTLGSFLFLVALSLLLSRKRTLLINVATGAAFGVLVLVVPTFAFTFVVGAIMAWALKYVRVRDLVPIGFVIALTIVPWTVRNYLAFHRFVPIASISGANLLIGNCETTIPNGGSGNIDHGHYDDEADALGLDEFDRDRFYRDAALTWIRNNPGRAFVLYLEKTANFFNVVNLYDARIVGEISIWKQAANGASYLFLMALLFWRLLELKKRPLTRLEAFLLVVYGLSAFTSAIFITRIRYRLPYDYLIITIVAIHLAEKWEAWRAGRAIPT